MLFYLVASHLYNARKLLGENPIIFEGGNVYTETFSIVALRTTIMEQPEKVQALLSRLLQAEAKIKENSEAAQEIVSRRTGMSLEVLKEIWNDFKFEVVLDPVLVNMMEQQARWAMDTGKSSEKPLPNFRDYIQLEPLRSLKPNGIHF